MQTNIKTIIIKCPRCGSDRIVSTHVTNAGDGVNLQKEYRSLNCGLRFDQRMSDNAASGYIKP